MARKIWMFCYILVMGCLLSHCHHDIAATRVGVVMKAESSTTMPFVSMSPPEGNTTFLDGTTWCVAMPGVGQSDLQIALDWACGTGSADCDKVQPGRECFEPNTLLSHASYAFNSFYQQNGNSDVACTFGGTAAITTRNPSYGSCNYPTSGPISSSPPPYGPIVCTSWGFPVATLLILLLYF